VVASKLRHHQGVGRQALWTGGEEPGLPKDFLGTIVYPSKQIPPQLKISPRMGIGKDGERFRVPGVPKNSKIKVCLTPQRNDAVARRPAAGTRKGGGPPLTHNARGDPMAEMSPSLRIKNGNLACISQTKVRIGGITNSRKFLYIPFIHQSGGKVWDNRGLSPKEIRAIDASGETGSYRIEKISSRRLLPGTARRKGIGIFSSPSTAIGDCIIHEFPGSNSLGRSRRGGQSTRTSGKKSVLKLSSLLVQQVEGGKVRGVHRKLTIGFPGGLIVMALSNPTGPTSCKGRIPASELGPQLVKNGKEKCVGEKEKALLDMPACGERERVYKDELKLQNNEEE